MLSKINDQWQISYDGVSPWTLLPAGSDIDIRTFRTGDFDGDGKTDVRWFYSSGAATSWLPLARSGYRVDDLRFGDFNGDDTTDVFGFANGEWSVSYGGATAWRRLNEMISSKLKELVFADFNGDGVTDIGRHKGLHYEVSWGGTTGWRRLHSVAYRTMPLRLPGMLLGDFNGDRRPDALHYQRFRYGMFAVAVGERFVMSSGASELFAVRSRHEMR
ncbi:MAG: FG-GAP repeat domain-containing protein [Longimicrobiales bacterium]